jgi:hypothetical protein
VLFKLLVEVSVGKAALRPMLLDDDVSLLRDKVRMPLTAPSTLRKNLVLSPGELPGIRVLPMDVVARTIIESLSREEFESICSEAVRETTEKFEATGSTVITDDYFAHE